MTTLTNAETKGSVKDPVLEKNPTFVLAGKVNLSYFFGTLDVYDLFLYGTSGITIGQENYKSSPLILKLVYNVNLDGKDIADRSKKEMIHIGHPDNKELKGWHKKMLKIFPKIKKGDSLTGVFDPKKGTEFYNKNWKKIGKISDPAFGHYFFGIWLDEKTSEPDLRNTLLGIEEWPQTMEDDS